jgi:C4-dicarboxylate-specific signal transduction histidine kinase
MRLPAVMLSLSLGLQLAAALQALLLIRVTGRKLAWIAISAALLLMAWRRVATLASFDQAVRFDLPEAIALAVSALMLLGVLLMRDYFRSLQRAEAGRARDEREIRRLNGELEQKVAQLQQTRAQLERRVAERTEELARSLCVLHATLNSSADGILSLLFADGAITCNEQFRELWAIPPGLIERGASGELIAFIAPQTRAPERFVALVQQHIAHPELEAVDVIELRDGRIFERYSRPQRIDGKPVGVVANYRDVSARTRAEQELRAVHSELQGAARLAGMAEIATNVLHNVGNVLNSVNVSAGLVGARLRDSKLKGLARAAALLEQHAGDLGAFLTGDARGKLLPAYLRELAQALEDEHAAMAEELRALSASVDHIKEIVAIQQSFAGPRRLLEPIRIDALLDDALRMNAGALTRHKVEVLRPAGALPALPLDRNRMLQILVNLIGNAKQALGEAAHARITLDAVLLDGPLLRVTVADNGEGIAPENLARIFAHGFTTRADGHGFGLHGSVLAAREMGGSLTVRSDGRGRGATFTLDVPVEAPARPAAGDGGAP